MNIAIIKYNAGNIASVLFALHRLGAKALITNCPEQIKSADKIIFPGVGEASTAMASLKERELDRLIPTLTQPVLGICLGMQLLCQHSEEGNTDCLGIFKTTVKKFQQKEEFTRASERFLQRPHRENVAIQETSARPCQEMRSEGPLLKITHIGWNKVNDKYYYFVHSYYAELCNDTTGITEYGISFSSKLQKDNFYGVQFHPEKSGEAGQQLIKEFLAL